MSKPLRKKFRFVISIILVLAMLGGGHVFAEEPIKNSEQSSGAESGTGYVFEMENIAIEEMVYGKNSKYCLSDNGSITISRSSNGSELYVVVKYGAGVIEGTVKGNAIELNSNDCSGSFGVYDGILTCKESMFSGEKYSIICITEDRGGAFISSTFYDDMMSPTCAYFGDYTDEIKVLHDTIKTMSKRFASEGKALGFTGSQGNNRSLDSAMGYRGRASVSLGSRTVGYLSIFHGLETLQTNIFPVSTKFNTNISEVVAYIQSDLGIANSYVSACADKVEIWICGDDDGFYSVYNSYEPVDGSTTVELTIPYYTPQTGFGTIDFTFATSNISTEQYKYSGSSPQYNGRKWTMTKLLGWSPSVTEGDETSQNGLSAQMSLTYQGSIANASYKMVESSARVRYMCYIDTEYGTIVNYYTGGQNTYYTFVMVYPAN